MYLYFINIQKFILEPESWSDKPLFQGKKCHTFFSHNIYVCMWSSHSNVLLKCIPCLFLSKLFATYNLCIYFFINYIKYTVKNSIEINLAGNPKILYFPKRYLKTIKSFGLEKKNLRTLAYFCIFFLGELQFLDWNLMIFSGFRVDFWLKWEHWYLPKLKFSIQNI